MHPMLNIAIQAARKAGRIITQSIERLDTVRITEKSRNDFVTEIDKKAEREIIATIHDAYPNHGIIAEESGVTEGKEDYVWVIDPLDGTANYIHNFPHFAISIACIFKTKIELGLIYDPIREELFTATRGSGAVLNDHKLRVSQCKKLEQAFIGTGFPFRNPQHFKAYINIFETLFPQISGMRRTGSAALDLAYVAAGRFDAFWEFSLKKWDMAAGVILIKEAGGLVSDLHGEEKYFDTGNIVAGNPKIFKALLQVIQPCLKEAEGRSRS